MRPLMFECRKAGGRIKSRASNFRQLPAASSSFCFFRMPQQLLLLSPHLNQLKKLHSGTSFNIKQIQQINSYDVDLTASTSDYHVTCLMFYKMS